MEMPTNEQLKAAISKYYKTHLSSGLRCEVKSLSMAEVEETGGKNITATVSFLHDATGESETNKVLIPCDAEGNLDWTNTKFLEDDHDVDPSKSSHPEVKSPAPLPANNEKPKAGGGQPPEKGTYIQKPEKVGAQGGKKIKTGEARKAIKHPKVLGTDSDGWPTSDQLELEEDQEEKVQQAKRDGYVHGEDDWLGDEGAAGGGGGDFDVFAEAGVSPVVAEQAMTSQLGESQSSPEGYVHGQDDDLEVVGMKGFAKRATMGEDIPLALVEYRTKSTVKGTGTALFEFGIMFKDEETRNAAKIAVESVEGVEDVELLEDVGIAIVCRQDEEIKDPSLSLAIIKETLGVNLLWDEGQEDKFKADLQEMDKSTHDYSDHKGKYRSGVQTSANEPGAAKPGGDQMKPDEEEGGPKKRKHTKTSGDQGGDGLGGAKSQTTPSVGPDGKESTKDAGQQAESLKEQDFLDDVMSYEGDDNGGEDGVVDDVGVEMDAATNADGAQLDDTIMALVAAQAEHGLEVVLQVAREQAETSGTELTPEQEEEIRAMYVEYAEAGGDDEEDAEVEVAAVEIDTDGDDDDDEEVSDGGYPFESKTKTEDVTVNVNDGGDANVSADGGEGDAATPDPVPAAEPVSTETPADATAEEPVVDPTPADPADDDDEDDDDKKKEPSEKPDEDEDKPDAKEALEILRNELIDELAEMDNMNGVLAIQDLDEEQLLNLDEALPAPSEDGRFKQLSKELGEDAEDSEAIAKYIGRKKYGKKAEGKVPPQFKSKSDNKAAKDKRDEKDKKKKDKKEEDKLGEESGIHGQGATVNGWAAGQPTPNQPLSFVGNDAYSFAQRIADKDPSTRKARVLKPGRFSQTTSRHSNMVARRLAKQGYEVDRVDAFDNDQAMAVGELNTELAVGLPEESLIKLSGARFKREAIKKLTDEQKGQLKEKLIARADKLAEDQQNPYTMGGPKSWQRVRGKEKNYNMFGRIKPGVKWQGLIRVVWDDGEESWEKSGDVQNVGSNPYKVKSPGGGPTKPGSQEMSKAGGEELDMLKTIEALKKLPRAQRFQKVVEMRCRGTKVDMDKIIPLLIEGIDEWDNFDVDALVAAVMPKPVVTESQEKSGKEEEDDDEGGVTMVMEDFGDEDEVTTTLTEEDLSE